MSAFGIAKHPCAAPPRWVAFADNNGEWERVASFKKRRSAFAAFPGATAITWPPEHIDNVSLDSAIRIATP
jgi:hypothetical protein